MTAFNDAEIIRLLSEQTIPVATHVRDVKRQDVDGEFFRKVTKPISYWQSGACVFTPDGRVLGTCSATSRKEVFNLLTAALPKYEAPAKRFRIEPINKVDEANRYEVKAPDGSLVVTTMMSHLSERGRGTNAWFDKLLSSTVATDRLWILKEEVDALSKGKFPDTLKKRIAVWHLVDSITFDQNRRGTVKRFDLELKDGRLTGSMDLDTGRHAMQLDLLGFIESKNGEITRFDIVAHGTRRTAKSGSDYPVAYAFSIADKNHVAYNVPPYPVLGYSTKVYFGK